MNKINSLEKEIQTLLSQLEEINYKLNRIEDTQQLRYVDLDKRIHELEGILLVQEEIEKTNIDQLDPLAGLIEEDDASNEFDLWSDSLQLIEDGRFAEASEKLRYLILSFPEGNFIGDALFWLGEIYYLQENYNDSSDSFNELISTYEQHNRIPDANFKLGMISLRSEDSNKAKEYFNYLINNYPDSGAGILAAEELKKIQ
ncbi:MAG: tetratricopeptide repeat protein [Gammaproteobacteria bacterium]